MKFFSFFLSCAVCVSAVLFGQEKLRVLYILYGYPQISETYMQVELESVWDEYDVQIVSMALPNIAQKNYFPVTYVREKTPHEQIGQIIEAFKPHVLHSHWLFHAPLVQQLAQKYSIPFTLRTHSFDILKSSTQELQEYCAAVNSDLCLGVLCFPGSVNRLIECGLTSKKIHPCWPVVDVMKFYATDAHHQTNKILNMGACLEKKNYFEYINFAKKMRSCGFEFSLYAMGYRIKKVMDYNEKLGFPVSFIGCVDYDEMPNVYQNHDWLVLTADQKINTVGLPLAIAEAQAAGIGVLWQELPGRRQEQLDYLGGAGFLYKDISQVKEIISQPYPEEMRLRGLENCKKCDIKNHKHLLTDLWESVR